MAGKFPIVGIDLGTTNSAVSCVDHSGRIVGIPNFQGDLLTPSAILIQDGAAMVGREARKTGPQSPEGFAEAFKRYMGDEYFPRLLDGKQWRPEILSAMILRRLRDDVARTYRGYGAAVITVPAYFDESRRRATMNAGAIAGWEVADIINEPTAAAIAYAHHAGQLGKKADLERVLVYDLGGGTFDTTLLEIRNGREYLALATDGEVRLGGCDWDDCLRNHLAELFTAKTGVNPLGTPRGEAEFLRLAQQAKHKLSLSEKADVAAAYQDRRAGLTVTRATFEALTAPLLERTKAATEELLDQAKKSWSDVDRVLAVGGSTRMPMVGRMLEEMSGKPVDRSLSADEAVAQGAAVYAKLKGEPGKPRVVNVNSHSLRVVGRNKEGTRVAAVIIPKNTPLPAEVTKLIPVQRAGMSEVYVPVCEGEADDPSLCEIVGQVKVSGIPQDGRRWIVGVMLRYREDGNVEVEASIRDPAELEKIAGRVTATLVPQRGMTPEQIAEARRLLGDMEIN